MARPSSIDKLPAEVRDAIGRLREQGRTLDEILAHLKQLDVEVSRSALGRHVKSMEAVGERLRRSRAIAEVLIRPLGDGEEGKTARLNIELAQSAILDLLMRSAEAQDTAQQDGEEESGPLDAMGTMLVAKGLEHLVKAQRHDVELIQKIEERAAAKAKREAAQAVETVAREKGLSRETVAAIKASVFGVAKA
ncbi:MAG: phage protein Gp27 family protein [Roseomonas mucosa]|nr:phage protein Gp27 family protein [Roseomonas mucosa]